MNILDGATRRYDLFLRFSLSPSRLVIAVSYTHLDVYKRQVVYVSDHSTVVKAEAISGKK